jgi:hypothetical protein
LILLLALLAGLIAGLLLALLQKRAWQAPPLRFIWVAAVAFLPQILAFYIPATRKSLSDSAVAASLIASQVMLLVFCWLNRRLAGIWLLALGLMLNLAVIIANGGFMPISPQTASHLIAPDVMAKLQVGERFGYGKDILLLPEKTNFVWLSDRFLPPSWSAYQVAFSLGDILIAGGAFWLMLTGGNPLRSAKGRKKDTR